MAGFEVATHGRFWVATEAEGLPKATITEANAAEAHTAETLWEIVQQYEDLANGKQ
jgi:hypothetical protein